MTDTDAQDRSVVIGRDAVNSVITSGDGNVVNIYYQVAAEVVAASAPDDFGANPYRGLEAFTELDAERFFGRKTLVGELWEAFRKLTTGPFDGETARVLSILGPSGSGKSSVARAGLLAEFARRPLRDGATPRIAVMRPGEEPIEALAGVLARIVTKSELAFEERRTIAAELRLAENGVHNGLRRIAQLPAIASEPLVVLVDQFEEVYSLCGSPADRRIFIETLLDAARGRDGGVSVILTLRSDFLGATQADSELNQLLAKQSVIVPAMSKDELRLAIKEPARKAGHPIDENTIVRLVNETEGRPGALPLLQFVLVEIWEGMAEGKEPEVTVDELGGVGGALGAKAQEIYAALEEPEKAIARGAFLAMVTFGEGGRPTRRQAPLARLAAVTRRSQDEVRAVLDRFADKRARLVTLGGPDKDSQTAEVTHEALFEHWDDLKAWLAEGRVDLLFHQRVAQEVAGWIAAGRAEGALWRPPNLDQLQAFAQRNPGALTDDEQAFLKTSEDVIAAERAAPWRRRLAAAAVLLVFLALQLALPRLFDPPRFAAFDTYQKLTAARRTPTKAPVVIVAIDDASLALLGRWPWKRDVLAEVVEKINRYNPRAIALDILLFDAPDPDDPNAQGYDHALQRAISMSPTILPYGASKDLEGSWNGLAGEAVAVGADVSATPSSGGATWPLPLFAGAALALGNDIQKGDADDVYRRWNLISRVQGQIAPSFLLQTLHVSLGEPPYALLAKLPPKVARKAPKTPAKKPPKKPLRPLRAIGLGPTVIPTGADGSVWLDYSRQVPLISAIDLRADLPADRLSGRTVLIGLTATGEANILATPVGRQVSLEVAATGLENLLSGKFAHRPGWALAAEAALTGLLGLLLIAVLPVARGLWAPLVLLAPPLVLAGVGYGLWHQYRLLIDVATPALGYLIVFIAYFGSSLLDVERRTRVLTPAAGKR